MAVVEFILFVLTLLILVRFWRSKISQKSSSTLPGPTSWRFLQNLREFMKAPHKVVTRWAETYGDIYQISFFGKRLVILNTIELAREGLNNPDVYMEQPSHSAFTTYAGGDYNVGCSASNSWPEMRKFLVKIIHDFTHGNGNAPLDSSQDDADAKNKLLFMQGVDDVIETMAVTKGQPVSARKFLTIPIFNVMWLPTAHKKMGEEKAPIIRRFHETFGAFSGSLWPTFFGPTLDRLYAIFGWQPTVVKNYKESIEAVWKFMDETIDEHEQNLEHDFQKNATTQLDYTTSFFQRRKQLEEREIKKSAFLGQDSRKRLRASILDMNFGGNGTVSLALEWTLAYVTAHPKIQTRIRQDLNTLLGPIGKGRTPKLADKKDLPLLEATLLEILRMCTPAPMVLHLASKDTTIGGHFVAKGSFVVINLFKMTFDEKNWTEPWTFKPERFIAKDPRDGSATLDHHAADSILTFSMGKRMCPGKPFAIDTLFILLAKILHRFNVKSVSHDSTNDRESVSEGVFDFFLKPQDSMLIFEDLLTSPK